MTTRREGGRTVMVVVLPAMGKIVVKGEDDERSVPGHLPL